MFIIVARCTSHRHVAHLFRHLALCRSQKPPLYDEFTVFGMPSGQDEVEKLGVRDCLQSVPEPSRLTPRPPQLKRASKLEASIAALEERVHYAFPPQINPENPFLLRKYRDPTHPQPNLVSSPRSLHSPRRPMSNVAAYRRVGLDHADQWLLPSATRLVESARSRPKYEEQMMLGFLSARAHRTSAQTPTSWKMKRFQLTSPRV